MTTIIRKRLARNFARSFAAGLVQNAEVELQDDYGLSEDELAEAHEEMQRIAARIERTMRGEQK
jgi:hypothetical protein